MKKQEDIKGQMARSVERARLSFRTEAQKRLLAGGGFSGGARPMNHHLDGNVLVRMATKLAAEAQSTNVSAETNPLLALVDRTAHSKNVKGSR